MNELIVLENVISRAAYCAVDAIKADIAFRAEHDPVVNAILVKYATKVHDAVIAAFIAEWDAQV